MIAHPSLLKCDSYFVTDLVLTANPNFDKGKPISLHFSDIIAESATEQVKPEKGYPFWRVTLKVTQNVGQEKNAPYNYAVSLLGTFKVMKDVLAPEKEKKIVEVNGASVLYGLAREVLKTAMCHGPFRPLILPTVSFVELPSTPGEAKIESVKESAEKGEA